MSSNNIVAAVQILTAFGINPRKFRNTQALMQAAKVATAAQRAMHGL